MLGKQSNRAAVFDSIQLKAGMSTRSALNFIYLFFPPYLFLPVDPLALQEHLLAGETAQDRPDVAVRVFRHLLHSYAEQVKLHRTLRYVLSWVCTFRNVKH